MNQIRLVQTQDNKYKMIDASIIHGWVIPASWPGREGGATKTSLYVYGAVTAVVQNYQLRELAFSLYTVATLLLLTIWRKLVFLLLHLGSPTGSGLSKTPIASPDCLLHMPSFRLLLEQ